MISQYHVVAYVTKNYDITLKSICLFFRCSINCSACSLFSVSKLNVTPVVPAGTLQVQIGVEIVVGNNPVGALYFDDLQMSYSGGMAQ